MGQFIVSARKYRPARFDKLIGQDNIARTLKNSIVSGQLAHAYLFCGPRGVGKTSTARIFAKTINCSNPGPDLEPCGECESCRSFAEGRSYCIHELDAASNNSVEDIRTLTDQVRIPPQTGRYSVYIIDEVHMLSQAAFNAFLKTLEEPPAHAIFILATTEKHKILPTILSRCQTYDFNRIRVEDIVLNLRGIAAEEGVKISEDAMHIIAQKADGAMRDALTLFDQTVAFCGNDITYEQVISNLNVLDYEYYFRLTDMFVAGNYADALVLFDEILAKGFNSLHFISGLSSHFRDLIVCCNATSRALAELAPSVAARYDEYCRKCNIGFLYAALAETTACEAAYKQSGNPRLLIEFTLIKLAKLFCPAAIPSVAAQPAAAPQAAPAAQPAVASRPATTPASAQMPAAQPAVASGPATSSAPAPTPAAQPAVASGPATSPAPAPTPAAQPAATRPASVAPTAEARPAVYQPEAGAATKPAEPQPAPRPAVGGLSIKNLMAQASADVKEEAEKERKAAEAASVLAPITPESLAAAWQRILEETEKPNLKAGLSAFTPTYDAQTNVITQTVKNKAQKDWIDKNCRLSLQTKLQRYLSNAGVHLEIAEVPLSEAEQQTKPYLPSEKAKVMMEKSQDLRDFVGEFQLELS